jgi:hypothetical protein
MPLVAIYEKPLYRATPRLQRMLMKLQRYDLRIVYVPGNISFRFGHPDTTTSLNLHKLSSAAVESLNSASLAEEMGS